MVSWKTDSSRLSPTILMFSWFSYRFCTCTLEQTFQIRAFPTCVDIAQRLFDELDSSIIWQKQHRLSVQQSQLSGEMTNYISETSSHFMLRLDVPLSFLLTLLVERTSDQSLGLLYQQFDHYIVHCSLLEQSVVRLVEERHSERLGTVGQTSRRTALGEARYHRGSQDDQFSRYCGLKRPFLVFHPKQLPNTCRLLFRERFFDRLNGLSTPITDIDQVESLHS